MNLLTAGLVWIFLPETKGKTLEEISEVFGDIFVAIHIDGDLKIEQPVDNAEEAAPAKPLEDANHLEQI